MDYSQHINSSNWNFNYSIPSNGAPLEEPVAFEDFQFSLGLDPEFAMPIPLDMPPPPPPPLTSNNMSESIFFPSEPVLPPPNLNNSVLNEHDQKTFSQFLDQFFVDPNMQIDPQFSMVEEPPMPFPYHHQSTHDEEYSRQSSILQSLDEQKKKLNQQKQQPMPSFVESKTKPNNGGGAMRRGKPHKELLTEEEKRSNHIASEQKRRSMIRTGFKDLTEIVPTLKNINNSKSTVLFKAVDYIKYLEKRNKSLRDKIKNLEVRVQVEQHTTTSNNNNMFQQRQLMELQEKLQLHQKLLRTQQQQESKKMEIDNSDSSLIKA
ncbi:MAG: hypothetical protein EXX96DRAFT_539695 [Benjaminiella poitrasii]|nr:MAG: hypothetical protein EXX96DRAFT_539695 [Benjaminiella poitrasii]